MQIETMKDIFGVGEKIGIFRMCLAVEVISTPLGRVIGRTMRNRVTAAAMLAGSIGALANRSIGWSRVTVPTALMPTKRQGSATKGGAVGAPDRWQAAHSNATATRRYGGMARQISPVAIAP